MKEKITNQIFANNSGTWSMVCFWKINQQIFFIHPMEDRKIEQGLLLCKKKKSPTIFLSTKRQDHGVFVHRKKISSQSLPTTRRQKHDLYLYISRKYPAKLCVNHNKNKIGRWNMVWNCIHAKIPQPPLSTNERQKDGTWSVFVYRKKIPSQSLPTNEKQKHGAWSVYVHMKKTSSQSLPTP